MVPTATCGWIDLTSGIFLLMLPRGAERKITEDAGHQSGIIAVNVMTCPLGHRVAAVAGQFSKLCLQDAPCRDVPEAAFAAGAAAGSMAGIVFAGGDDGQRQGAQVSQAGPALVAAPADMGQFGHIGPALARGQHERAPGGSDIRRVNASRPVTDVPADTEIIGEPGQPKWCQPPPRGPEELLTTAAGEPLPGGQALVHVGVAGVDQRQAGHTSSWWRAV